jgi:hypothetical protein
MNRTIFITNPIILSSSKIQMMDKLIMFIINNILSMIDHNKNGIDCLIFLMSECIKL